MGVMKFNIGGTWKSATTRTTQTGPTYVGTVSSCSLCNAYCQGECGGQCKGCKGGCSGSCIGGCTNSCNTACTGQCTGCSTGCTNCMGCTSQCGGSCVQACVRSCSNLMGKGPGHCVDCDASALHKVAGDSNPSSTADVKGSLYGTGYTYQGTVNGKMNEYVTTTYYNNLPKVNIGGTWHEVTSAKSNIDGTWKMINYRSSSTTYSYSK